MALVGDLRVLLRFPDFRRLLAVRLLSQGADGVYQVGLAAYVVFSPEKETSAGAIASAMAVLLLPYSLVGPFAGVLLDRLQRRQVFLYGNLLRALLALATAALVAGTAPGWLFYVSALAVTAVNRFVLAGLSAALPHVVDAERLVLANSLSPTAGTLAATLGGGLAFVVRLAGPDESGPASVVTLSAALYLASALTALRIGRALLGPDADAARPGLGAALLGTARGLAAGVRHLAAPRRRRAARALLAMTLMRFCYGALTVMVLMLCRYAWPSGDTGVAGRVGGLALLGLAVSLSGAGFFAAAVLTPVAVARLGAGGWIIACSGAATLLVPPLGLPFAPVPLLVAAFILGLITQGAKISTDTVVQSSVDDRFRGRIFSVYDVLFNVAFVGAAGVAALILPPDGRSTALVVTVTAIYGATTLAMARFDGR
ncbi:MFS transporter [Streptomyces sp. TS71-3]|uniref:MFS transporter n=1 Tax=Streptomyces sp. TS71-3 TaxID=2733862 RepID=UPI001B1AD096|nr:MFS transporter [Streptomyces sp. TS71-3]GHJ40240.1 MFS transporter [Streptomyces sp. TS71-3]